MSLQEEGRKKFMKDMFKEMNSPEKRGDVLNLFEKFLHNSPKKITGIETVLEHINSGKDLNNETIKQNIKAILNTTKEHEIILSNLSCIIMMLIFSKEWGEISRSARINLGEDQLSILKEQMGSKFK